MKAVFVLFDSLNRLAIGSYGGTEIATPNFDRFAERARVFDAHYVGSLPCMPARRDMHTGRLNFTHRSWGPLEPFDNSFPEILKKAGIHTHLISDHLHYFEDGGAGYHTRFSTWDFIRGQEHDPWVAMVEPPVERYRESFAPGHYAFERGSRRMQGMINRERHNEEADFPGPRCFASAFDFLGSNHGADNWFLMLECFDPHEPFHAPERFKDAYRTGYAGKIMDWPRYVKVTESAMEVREIRANYAALVAMCDDYFGRLLDFFDRHDMWHDTALILTTDHGFLLSEHDWWGKMRMPYYEEISHIPLMIHDPRTPEAAGTRCGALSQTMDLMPTILGLYGQDRPPEVRGVDLGVTGDRAEQAPEVAVFGLFGGPIGVTDGRYALYHYPPDLYAEGLRQYTLAPSHMASSFSIDELKTASLARGFDFTKGAPVLAVDAPVFGPHVPRSGEEHFAETRSSLFDLEADPKQATPLDDPVVSARLLNSAVDVLKRHDTPEEVYRWYGLETVAGISSNHR